jgi:hypothetical protein
MDGTAVMGSLDLIGTLGALESVVREPGLFQVTFSMISTDGTRVRVTLSIDLRKATLTAAAFAKALSWATSEEELARETAPA